MNKIGMARIEFGFSENPLLAHRVFTSWAAADAYVRPIAEEKGNRGYDKTDFSVTFADGYVYQGRLDVNCQAWSVARHIRENCAFYAGLWHPDHMSDAQYDQFLAMQAQRAPHSQAEHRKLLATYEIGDPVARVISLGEVKGQKLVEALTPRQHLMCAVASAFVGRDFVAGRLAEGDAPEAIFDAVAMAVGALSDAEVADTLRHPHWPS